MADLCVDCPKCGEKIPLSETLTQQLAEELRGDIEAQAKTLFDKKLAEELEKLKADADQERADLQEQLEEQNEKLQALRQQERDLQKQKRELEAKQEEIDLEIDRRVDAAKKEAEERVAERVAEENRLKNLEKDEQLARLRQQIEDSSARPSRAPNNYRGRWPNSIWKHPGRRSTAPLLV